MTPADLPILMLVFLYRQLVGQWQDMAEQAEGLEKMARELEAEMERLTAAQRHSEGPPKG